MSLEVNPDEKAHDGPEARLNFSPAVVASADRPLWVCCIKAFLASSFSLDIIFHFGVEKRLKGHIEVVLGSNFRDGSLRR